jgi:hypothetical protein
MPSNKRQEAVYPKTGQGATEQVPVNLVTLSLSHRVTTRMKYKIHKPLTPVRGALQAFILQQKKVREVGLTA